jgi:hypothetical protein
MGRGAGLAALVPVPFGLWLGLSQYQTGGGVMHSRSVQSGRSGPLSGWPARLLLVLGAVLTAACGDVAGGDRVGKTYPPYRYRLTVEIETPEGLRTGSSVIEVHTAMAGPKSIPNPGQVSTRIKGEAVAIDLPGGQTLFALLRSDGDIDWPAHVYAWLVPHASEQQIKARAPDGQWSSELDFDLWMEQIIASRGPRAVARTWKMWGKDVSNWPTLVRFRDIRDPATVEQVDPDNLKASFGKGYAVRNIIAERTEEEVGGQTSTRLSEHFFQAWAAQNEATLNNGVLDNPYFQKIEGKLSRNDFIGD